MSESTRVILFYINEGRHLRFTARTLLDDFKVNIERVTRLKRLEHKQARNFATRLADLHTKLR